MFDDFDMISADWMSDINIKKSYAARTILKCIKFKYSGNDDKDIKEKVNYLYNKVLTVHQKLTMMMFAEYHIKKAKNDFECKQNMDVPAFYGLDCTSILFYVESMIVFARNALDVAASVYNDLIFEKRSDSFNDFSKRILKSEEISLKKLKDYFEKSTQDKISVYRLLCGSKKGRALRDIIIHQANIKLEYLEYKESSEKERLFLVLKDFGALDFELFVAYFIKEVECIFHITSLCCMEYLKK